METQNKTCTTFLTDPLLQSRIANISRGDEDTAQAISLRLLDLAHTNPGFAAQEPGYLIKRAAWEARHVAEKAVIYDQYVLCEPYVTDLEGDNVSAFDEYFPSEDLTPEQAVCQVERMASLAAAIQALPALQRRVMSLLAAFYKPSEIAVELGVSRSVVSHAIARGRAALAAVAF